MAKMSSDLLTELRLTLSGWRGTAAGGTRAISERMPMPLESEGVATNSGVPWKNSATKDRDLSSLGPVKGSGEMQ